MATTGVARRRARPDCDHGSTPPINSAQDDLFLLTPMLPILRDTSKFADSEPNDYAPAMNRSKQCRWLRPVRKSTWLGLVSALVMLGCASTDPATIVDDGRRLADLPP